ncbi:hypothetical protein Bbelb_071000 [Branchiostoma belcheri]|nr:hypothetical protein Bbelb_071000 [Branchiostoma belcheri]
MASLISREHGKAACPLLHPEMCEILWENLLILDVDCFTGCRKSILQSSWSNIGIPVSFALGINRLGYGAAGTVILHGRGVHLLAMATSKPRFKKPVICRLCGEDLRLQGKIQHTRNLFMKGLKEEAPADRLKRVLGVEFIESTEPSSMV